MVHDLAFFGAHDLCMVVVANEVEDAVGDAEGGLFVWILFPEQDCWADETLTEAVVARCFFKGEGDAVGWAWVIEELGVEITDFRLWDKVNGNLITCNGEKIKARENETLNLGRANG